MGPRLFRRGNAVISAEEVSAFALLQWGHVFSDVEILMMMGSHCPSFSLQWGHVFSDVEMSRARRYRGARLAPLQWGHVFSDVEMACA